MRRPNAGSPVSTPAVSMPCAFQRRHACRRVSASWRTQGASPSDISVMIIPQTRTRFRFRPRSSTRGQLRKPGPSHQNVVVEAVTGFCTPRSLRKRAMCLKFRALKSRGRTDGLPTCANTGRHTTRTGKPARNSKHEGCFRSE